MSELAYTPEGDLEGAELASGIVPGNADPASTGDRSGQRCYTIPSERYVRES